MVTTSDFSILKRINSPDDLKTLSIEELKQLSGELRNFIIDVVSENSGHLGSSLGVIELTVALHFAYNAPYDQIVWDVGHQAYGHKILTGRRDVFHTNRKYKGIGGFPRRDESPYDAFVGGHASVAISAALGMAVAAQHNKEDDKRVVAIIGDGSMSGGLAFEGLNNAGIQNADLLVIVNDNNIAIDANVGALKEYLIDITSSSAYNKLKKDVWDFMGVMRLRNPRRFITRIQYAIKSFLFKKSNLFESLGFRYFGPIDGHDMKRLVKILQDLRKIKGPKVLHVVTTKGKGYKHAEIDQTAFHAPGKFNKSTGEIYTTQTNHPVAPKYQEVFGRTLLELAEKNDKIVGITPAMLAGSSMNIMNRKMPERIFDVGIAEAHAVTFSAGLASQGLIPFCNIYSSFMQRAFDQVIHDVAIQNLQVVFCLDRAGLVGNDGPTHHGAYDLAFMRCVPNLTIAAPMNEVELRDLMFTAQLPNKGPFVIRYPKGQGVMVEWRKPMKEIVIGKGEIIKEGSDLAIITLGHAGNFAVNAVKKIADQNLAGIYNMRFLKPIDADLLHHIMNKYKNIITLEDGTVKGGLGSAVVEFAQEHGYRVNIKIMGIPDRFVEQGSQEELYAECGFDEQCICKVVDSFVKHKVLQIH